MTQLPLIGAFGCLAAMLPAMPSAPAAAAFPGFPPRAPHRAALLALAATVLVGCAGVHAPAPGAAPAGEPAPALGSQEGGAAPQAGEAAPKAAQDLPNVDLSRELLFGLLYGEMALQRGQPGDGYQAYLQMARQTRDPRLARRATEIAISLRALPQALEASALWHEIAPADPEAEQAYTTFLVANGRYDDARPLLERAMAGAGNPLEVLERVQRVLAHAPQAARGYAMLEALARKPLAAPASAFDAHVILARAAHGFGDEAAALKHARAALQLRPDSEPAVIAVAQLLAQGERPADSAAAKGPTQAQADAAAMLARFLQSHPDAIDARLAYARTLVGADRLEDAQREFEELQRRAPQNPDPLFALGVLALEAERFGPARDNFQRYLDLVGAGPGRDLEVVYLNMARVAEGEHRYDEALEWLRKVQSPEQAAVAREREAFVLGRMNRVDEAMALLQQLPGANDDERTQRTLLQGQLLRDAHRYQASYDLLDQALQVRPDDTGLLYETAMSAERLDRIDVMETRLRRLLELRPDYAHAYNALGYSLADRNIRLQEAYQLIDHALALAPEDGFIVDSMGWVQYRMGNLPAARATLTRAFKLKADPDVAAHLGEVLWASGDQNGARALLLDAQRRDGDSDTLRDTLRRLNINP